MDESRDGPLRVLHLLSNWKWTERSEPAANAAAAEARIGLEVRFVAGAAPVGAQSELADHLAAQGLDHELWEMPKHLRVGPLVRDVRRLRALIGQWRPHVVHCHMLNAHLAAAIAVGRRPGGPRIVRSFYEPGTVGVNFRERWLTQRRTDGVVVISESARDHAVNRLHVSQDAVRVIEPGIDLDRFSPSREIEATSNGFGLPPGAFVIGIVSRLRPARRIDLVLEAVSLALKDFPNLHVLVVGRGTEDKVRAAVDEPAEQFGIADRVHRAGYCAGDRLVAAFRVMHLFAYPAPGTDPSCRTVREAMAAGRAVVASRTGYIPYLLRDGETGFVVDPTPEAFARAIRDACRDEALRRSVEGAALADARRRFDLPRQAAQAAAFYESLMAMSGGRRPL